MAVFIGATDKNEKNFLIIVIDSQGRELASDTIRAATKKDATKIANAVKSQLKSKFKDVAQVKVKDYSMAKDISSQLSRVLNLK
jgi:hypothetical protein